MRIEGLVKTIDQKDILNDLTLTLRKGEITGLIGTNGSGKTTFFRSIAGHYELDQGKIFIDDVDIQADKLLKQQIFYIDEQYNFLSSYSLNKLLLFYQNAYAGFNKEKYLSLLKKNNLNPNTKYRSMSKGMQGLYKMILAICSNADYLLLDEPLDGLDLIVKKNVLGLLLDDVSENQRAIVISSHNLSELESIIDRALILKNQHIQLDYHLEDLRENARKIQMVFKTKKVPQIVKQNSQLLHFQGRVVTSIFENYTEELKQAIEAEQPVLFEELPLTLEDVFEANFAHGKTDYSLQGEIL
ncbi:ATP-binding cassette domain-containing protein [Enterococcus sp. 5H]|uniref:ATP-binding cassette domain-containing protein n=1 Tax=Enterococcus sp. 5H TaxID=1229490 RepID=UPI0023025C6D|nr:ABC transporter ATP-binding protein [Enterococcus sp. 5H]MDA9470393.1 ABC transporter, ATP-binding protein [Enterococcus sp. 5H]